MSTPLPPPPRALIFDLDGTLVDSHAAIEASVRHTLAAHAVTVDEARLADAMSRPLRELFRHVAPGSDEARVDRLAATYLEHYVATMIDRAPPFVGVVDMLRACANLGLPLAVLTNKTERNGRLIVEAHFGTERFREIVGSIPERANKPAPEGALWLAERLAVPASESWLVGDSSIDVATARNAGMTSVAVLWGLGAAGRAKVADADFVVETPTEFLDLVHRALDGRPPRPPS